MKLFLRQEPQPAITQTTAGVIRNSNLILSGAMAGCGACLKINNTDQYFMDFYKNFILLYDVYETNL